MAHLHFKFGVDIFVSRNTSWLDLVSEIELIEIYILVSVSSILDYAIKGLIY